VLRPGLGAQACSFSATKDSLDGPSAPVTSVVMGPPLRPTGRFQGPAFPVVPRCLACLVLQTRPAVTRFPFLLVCFSLPSLDLLPVLQLPRLPTALMKFPFRVVHAILLWFCAIVMMRFLSRPRDLLFFTPSLLLSCFPLNQVPAPQAGGCGQCSLGYG
jgi:hypothetical protein